MPVIGQDQGCVMDVSRDQLHNAQRAYTLKSLNFYDMYVLGFSNRFVWKSPTPKLLRLFDQHITGNHLDVGVGSGYFPDRCQFPVDSPRLVLMDINQQALTFAGRRLARYKPDSIQHNIFEPLEQDIPKFDSVSMNYLLHCLPGTLHTKSKVFDTVKPLLNSGGIIFGTTILQGGIQPNLLASGLMSIYNKKEILVVGQMCVSGVVELTVGRASRSCNPWYA